MTEYSFVAIVVGMIFAMVFGNAIGGYAGDIVIEATHDVFEHCKTVEGDRWRAQCDQIEENFEKTLKMNEGRNSSINLSG